MAQAAQPHVSPGNSQRLTLNISHCIENLKIFELSGRQSLSAPYEFTARFICAIPDLDLNQLVKQAAIINLYYKNESRYFHGIIKDAAMQGENGQSYVYEITLVPKLWFLKYRTNCRIFQHKTVPQIVTQLLEEAGLETDEFQFFLKENYQALDYIVQFNESDFAFISRLLERHGIHYHFVHQHNKHQLVFADMNESLPRLDDALQLRPRNGLEADYSSLASFQLGARTGFDHAAHRGFNIAKPAADLSSVHSLKDSSYLEHYSFHEQQSFQDAAAGQHYINQSLQAFQAQSYTGQSDSDVIRMEPGYRFTLSNHIRPDFNQQYLIRNVEFHVRHYAALEEYAPTDSGFHYHNTTSFMPDNIPFKAPQITPRPQLDYQDGVFVTGPEGEEIYTDKLGRVKVQFPWDREGQNDENSSCWLPVSQSWAGNQWGKIHIPRIGHEVLVSFINGDPDQPIIMGSLYNALNRPPYTLPEHKTRSTTKSNSSIGGKGFNEIRIEDKKGQEQIAIFAERDIDNRVKNDRREHIEHDRHLIVEQQRFEHIKNNKHLIVDKDQFIEIAQNASLSIGQNHHLQVGQDFYLDAGDEIHIKAGNKLVFDAGNMLSMKAGGSVMKTDASGVGFGGSTIRINEGGSPGSGSGANPAVPKMPEEVDKDFPGYKSRLRTVTVKYNPLKLMAQAIPAEPKYIPQEEVANTSINVPLSSSQAEQEAFYFSAQLRDHNNAILAGINYELTLDAEVYKGTTDQQGFIEYELERKPAKLTLSYQPYTANPDYIEYWQGSIDTLQSDTNTTGQQQRLQQQGYYPGALDGQDMGKTASAWAKFTRDQQQDSRDSKRLNNPEAAASKNKE